jgi:membrane-associated phospholipid phosphatase
VTFLAVHAALLAAVWIVPLLVRGPFGVRVACGVLTLVGLPTVFSTLGAILPGIHPEPFEWRWLAWDRRLFGSDPTVELQVWLVPWTTEVLQWAYASFYFVPIAAVAAAGAKRGGGAFDKALLHVQFGFLCSYLGYVLWPTLPPYLFLDHGEPLRGVFLAERIHAWIDSAEINRWDCFPSGHTMLSLLSLVIAWRYARLAFWLLGPLVVLVVFSTMALRYHFVVDVIAGALAVPPVMVLGRWLAAGWGDGRVGEPA